jgi:hypothetical protein
MDQLKDLATMDEVGTDGQAGITPMPREGVLPLSLAQQRLWFLTQLEQRSDNYHIPLALRLRGALDVAALREALNRLWARHESLRSVFVSVDGQPEVRLLSPAPKVISPLFSTPVESLTSVVLLSSCLVAPSLVKAYWVLKAVAFTLLLAVEGKTVKLITSGP